MSDDQAAGLEPSGNTTAQAAADAPATSKAAAQFDETYVKELREEAASWRKQFRDAQTALKEAQAQVGQSAELTQKFAALEAQLADAATKTEAAQKAAALTRLAAKAGIDPDVAALLDLTKIDLDNEKAALETLSKLAGNRQGREARPGTVGSTGMTEAELRASLFAPRKSTIFGG